MKTKKFLMTTLLVMGMVIAKAANGFPPELVLVSQPVLTYNANSVTVYYDVQNIGDYTFRGNIYIYLDPDDGYYYAKKWVRVCPGRIRRVAITIPAYRMNPAWVYTVMPYYELGDELYSFTVFEYFEPLYFHWYGYRNEPWVVIHVGPRPRHYHRPCPYRFYYDGYRPILPPPPGGYPPGYFDHMAPLNPAHHTYGYHHNSGGYPANYRPEHEIPGYHNVNDATAPQATVRPSTNNTSGSMSSSTGNRPANNGSASGSMSGHTDSGSNNASAGSMSGRSDSGSSRVSGSESSRPSSSATSGRTDNSSSSSRNDNRSSGRTDNSSSSGRVSSSDSGRSSGTSSGRTDNGSSSGRVSGSDSGRSSGTSSGRSSGSSSGRVSGSDSGRSSGTSSGRSSGNSSSSSSSGRSSGSSVSSGSSSSSSSSGRSSATTSSSSGRSSSGSAGRSGASRGR